MTERARRLVEDAMALSAEERLDVAEQLLSSLPAEEEWLAELEQRARRAIADPHGAEPWDVVKHRIGTRLASR